MYFQKILIILFLFIGVKLYALPSSYYTNQSKLASGKWIKVRVAKSGIYKYTYQDLKALGFSDPDKVKIYGYGGYALPEQFSTSKQDDLPEVAVRKLTGNDQTFGPDDFLLFYACGPTEIKPLNSTYLIHENNPYSDFGYYFLSDSDNGSSKLVGTIANEESADNRVLEYYDDLVVHERDLVSVANTGREFYGEDFTLNNLQHFPFHIPGIKPFGTINLQVEFIAKDKFSSTLYLGLNDQSIGQITFNGNSNYYDKSVAINRRFSYSKLNEEGQYKVTLNLEKKNYINAHLNYIRIQTQREIRPYGDCSAFQFLREGKAISLNGDAHEIWDVTDPVSCSIVEPDRQDNSFAVKRSQKFIFVNLSGNFEKPETVGKIPNQNLHALPFTDMVIITDPEFMSEALELADFHKQTDNLLVTVVTPEVIYNEFSSGTPDVSAYRWFMKMFYDKAEHETEKPKYLLLLGDGCFDNRNILRAAHSTKANRILTYQSVNSTQETVSFTTDDYIGFLEDNSANGLENAMINLGIGRIPARNRAEVKAYLAKLYAYAANKDRSSWKNQLLFVGDDGDGNLHMQQADKLAGFIESKHKEFNVQKVYLDSYKLEPGATGNTYPDAKRKMYELLRQGMLMVNLVGHGSNVSWTGEEMITLQDIDNMYFKRLPLWITATCDFSRFDDYTTSAGEKMLFHPQGGAIGLFSTTRVVYSGPNFIINDHLCRNLFHKKANGQRQTLGDILREAKRTIIQDPSIAKSDNHLKFALLGDPALKLSYPEYSIQLTHINGKPIDSVSTDTIKALSHIKIKGQVINTDNEIIHSFNGLTELTLYDAAEKRTTRDNDGDNSPFIYYDRSKVLFKSKGSVTDGIFELDILLPKDISYKNDLSKLSFYASDSEGHEAQGYYDQLVINGASDEISLEENPPVIKTIYLNTPSFTSQKPVNDTPLLYAEITDDSGFNISQASIGHEMEVMISGNTSARYTVNDFYEPASGSIKDGIIRFPVPALNNGEHEIKLRIWDIFNNSATSAIKFKVDASAIPEIFSVHYKAHAPSNIATIGTEGVDFYIRHNRPESKVRLEIKVYALSGQEIWSTERQTLFQNELSDPIRWDLTDHTGKSIEPGVYIFRVFIATANSKYISEAKKMIVVSQ